jgi:hypothetical protein
MVLVEERAEVPPLIPKSVDISGFIYDVKSGKLLPVI